MPDKVAEAAHRAAPQPRRVPRSGSPAVLPCLLPCAGHPVGLAQGPPFFFSWGLCQRVAVAGPAADAPCCLRWDLLPCRRGASFGSRSPVCVGGPRGASVLALCHGCSAPSVQARDGGQGLSNFPLCPEWGSSLLLLGNKNLEACFWA